MDGHNIILTFHKHLGATPQIPMFEIVYNINLEPSLAILHMDLLPELNKQLKTYFSHFSLLYRTIGSIFSGQASQPQTYVYRKFRVMSGHKCKLLCKAQSACIAW